MRYILSVLLLLMTAITITAQDDDQTPAQFMRDYGADECSVNVPAETPYHTDIQEAVEGELDEGTYPVGQFLMARGLAWFEVFRDDVPLWINANDTDFTIATSCLLNAGLTALETGGSNEPPTSTAQFSLPYGACTLMDVPESTPYSPAVQETDIAELNAGDYTVRDFAQFTEDSWVGVYGGDAGDVAYIDTAVLADAQMTPSCLVFGALLYGTVG